ncbi:MULTISPECIES: hypothetical protein [unclassified Rhizobium]|uniref:hypothetical protein n=1 Tax=unclassified Rhizobium TaxID=2613769 RepID=UPI0013C4363F|nr:MULTISPECIES: hypothetical protein [unclassified Rhizobium]
MNSEILLCSIDADYAAATENAGSSTRLVFAGRSAIWNLDNISKSEAVSFARLLTAAVDSSRGDRRLKKELACVGGNSKKHGPAPPGQIV